MKFFYLSILLFLFISVKSLQYDKCTLEQGRTKICPAISTLCELELYFLNNPKKFPEFLINPEKRNFKIQNNFEKILSKNIKKLLPNNYLELFREQKFDSNQVIPSMSSLTIEPEQIITIFEDIWEKTFPLVSFIKKEVPLPEENIINFISSIFNFKAKCLLEDMDDCNSKLCIFGLSNEKKYYFTFNPLNNRKFNFNNKHSKNEKDTKSKPQNTIKDKMISKNGSQYPIIMRNSKSLIKSMKEQEKINNNLNKKIATKIFVKNKKSILAPLKTIKDKNIPIKKNQGIINYSKPALYEKDKIGLPQVYKTPSFFMDGVKELQKQKVQSFQSEQKKLPKVSEIHKSSIQNSLDPMNTGQLTMEKKFNIKKDDKDNKDHHNNFENKIKIEKPDKPRNIFKDKKDESNKKISLNQKKEQTISKKRGISVPSIKKADLLNIKFNDNGHHFVYSMQTFIFSRQEAMKSSYF